MRLVHIDRSDAWRLEAVCLMPLCDWKSRAYRFASEGEPKTLGESSERAAKISAAIHAGEAFPAADEQLLRREIEGHLWRKHRIRDGRFVLDGFYAPGDEPLEAA